MNKDNPYSKLISFMREEGAVNNPPSILLAEVSSAFPDVTITIGKLQLDRDNLYFADHLVPDYKREVEIESESISVPELTDVKGDMTFKDSLEVGDIVAVLPTADKQQYIVLARVVRA
jgi:hypothetical protein